MKHLSFHVISVMVIAVIGCHHQLNPSKKTGARVLRVFTTDDKNKWQISINAKHRATASCGGGPLEIRRLALRHGDIILCQNGLDLKPGEALETATWVYNYSLSNQVALYVLPNEDIEEGIFSVPVYHWVAPFTNPRSLQAAKFFHEGELLGTGYLGYNNMLLQLKQSRLKIVFILGSAYSADSGLGPLRDTIRTANKSLATCARYVWH